MALKFLVTDESGRVARWLRLMGYDTALTPAKPLSELYRRAYREARVVVTRNRKVGASCLFRVIQLRSVDRDAQLRQILQETSVGIDERQAFSRCDQCNVVLRETPKARVQDRVPPYVFSTQERFHTCPACGRIYWAATHWQRACTVFKSVSGTFAIGSRSKSA